MNNDNTNNEEQIRTVSNSEVTDVALKMMDRFDEAFKELAK
jgi:hypothetical protein